MKERGADGVDTTAAIFLLKKRRPEIYGDQHTTVNQNLRVTLMSPEQRDADAQALLERLATLLPPTIDGEAAEIGDDEDEEAEERVGSSK